MGSSKISPGPPHESPGFTQETRGPDEAIKIHAKLGLGKKPNAIPVDFADMRERLMVDFPQWFDGSKQNQRKTFRRLADRIWLANSQRLNRLFQRWTESYRFFNPDQGGVVHPKEEISSAQFDRISRRFKEVLYAVLEKAGFAMLPDHAMEEAVENRVLGGLNLLPPPKEAVEYEIFYRGAKSDSKVVRNFRTWFRARTVQFSVYNRLLVVYRIKQHPDDLKEKKGCFGIQWPFLVKIRNMYSLGGETVTPLDQVDGQLIFMKLFKDVNSLDVDIMIPGSSMEFTWLDVAMIWLPTLFGLYFAIDAVVKLWEKGGTGLLYWATLVVLMVMPLSWGYKAWKETKNKENECVVELGKIYMTQNLNNNQGVCSDLLDDAHEQESNEAMLAYFFLWEGLDNCQFKEKGLLDREVEEYLRRIMRNYNQDPGIDFDVQDAVDKLVQMGLCTRKVLPDGSLMYRVASLDEASELMNPVRIAAFLNSLAPQQARGPCAMSDWREEVVVHPATNARIRYFWNAVTGAQQFNLPDTYFPRNFNSAGTWVSPEPTAKHVNLTQGLGLKATSNTDGTAPRGSSQFPPIKP